MSRTRRTITILASLALPLAVLGVPAAADDQKSGAAVDRIDLPDGWQPEGITADGHRLYVGSLADGSLLWADPDDGRTRVLPRSEVGKPAVGLDHDDERHVLWVAGGPAGEIRAHDDRSGQLLGTYDVPGANRFINDLVVTEDAVYATDSFHAELAVVPLDDDEVPPSGEATVLPLAGDFQQKQGFNANGIVQIEDDWLVLVQSNTGNLYRVDPGSGESDEIDLGGATLENGDGLEADDTTLYVVRNRDNLVAVVELDDDVLAGEVVAALTDPDLDVPTTAALVDDDLFAVNARFGTTAPDEPADAEYWVTRLTTPDDDDADDDETDDDDADDDEADDKDD